MEHLFATVTSAAHYIIPFLLVLSVVVFAHEFGHYWVARRCGVRVESFSLGFGPEIFGWNDRHGTRWMVSWIPLGGYVKMFGDSDPSSALPGEIVKTMTVEEKKVAFYFQPVAKRMAIVVAGPLANYVFAILLFAGLFVTFGQPYSPPVVDKVVETSAAAKAGIMGGDHILTMDGATVDSFEDIKRIVTLNVGTPMNIRLMRKGVEKQISVTPDVVQTTDRLGGTHRLGRLGISSASVQHKQLSVPRALIAAGIETWNMTASTLRGVGQIIMGVRGTEELGGPLRIAEMSGKVAEDGASAILWFMAVISLNLGLLNLFPIPLLDGGHLVFYLAESLRGRPLSERAQEFGARIGMALVLSLMVLATWNDLVHLKVIAYLRHVFS